MRFLCQAQGPTPLDRQGKGGRGRATRRGFSAQRPRGRPRWPAVAVVELWRWFRRREDRPRAKGGGVPLGSRRWCSGPIQQKKRPDLGLACHVEPDRPNSCCCIGQECAVPKITCDVSDRKPAPTCQEKKNWIFFLSSPEHNQKPPTDTANRHCAFIPTRRKIAVWPQGAQSTAPLARGRS